MKLFVGLDVSLEKTAICVISEHGKILKEAPVASEPEALLRWIGDQDGAVAAVGLEAGPLSQWLHRGLSEAGQAVVLMETRQVKGALKAMPIKTDRRDARSVSHACCTSAGSDRFIANRCLHKKFGPCSALARPCNRGSSHWKCQCAGSFGTSASRSAPYRAAGLNSVSANWRRAIRCWRRPPNPCCARDRRCGESWRALNAMSANSPKRIRSVVG